jgi:FtsZ-binding cell division protein ZapB
MTPAASGTGMACTSDETLKENIVNLNVDTALERILKIESVRYSMIKDPESKRYTGFIAQQLQKVIPEMVREEEDGKLQVYYDGLVPWITAAIKSLYNKISNIRTQVELLIESFKKFQSYTQREVASLRTENLDLKKENEQIKQENTIQFRQIQELRSYLCQRDPAASICK